MDNSIDLLAGLYHFRLGLIYKDRYMYAIYDLDSDDVYEDMSIYYIRSLLMKWTQNRKQSL